MYVLFITNTHIYLQTHAGALSSRKESAWCCGSLVLLIYTTKSTVMTEVGRLLQMSAITTAIVFGLFHVLCRKLLNYSWYSPACKGLMHISCFFHRKIINKGGFYFFVLLIFVWESEDYFVLESCAFLVIGRRCSCFLNGSMDIQHQKQALICIWQRELSFSNSTKALVCHGAANAKLSTCPGLAYSIQYSASYFSLGPLDRYCSLFRR